MDKKQFYKKLGIAVTFLSAAVILKGVANKKSTSAKLVLTGLVGFAAGVAIAYSPVREARKRLTMQDMLDDSDAELIEQNIAEALGSAE